MAFWKLLKHHTIGGLAALGLLALAACSTPRDPVPEQARPALWKVADEDTTIYLFGTIHLLPKGYRWRTPAIDHAISSSDNLVIETSVGGDLNRAAKVMMSLGLSPGLPPLLDRVKPEKRDALEQMIAATGIPRAALDRMESWAVALTLAGASIKSLGLSQEDGVERSLDKTFETAGKKVSGLETAEEQLSFFDRLSPEAQRTLLESTAEDPAEMKKEFETMLAAWARGDVAAISRTFDDATRLSAELRQVLIIERNRRWTDWIDDRLDRPGTIFIAVGAGHLAGKDNVQTMLEAKGIRSTRIQ